MPSWKACPGVDRKVMALACVAITDRPTVHQRALFPPLR